MSGRQRTVLECAAVFALCAGGFYAILAVTGPDPFDIDALFHYKVASLILRQGPWVDISWLPFTVLGEHGTDHQWLFHALLAPLTLMGDSLRALNAAAAIAGAAMAAVIVAFLRGARVPWPALFAVLMMFAADILPGRYICLRAQDIAVVFMVAMLFAIAWRRTAWVGVVAFLFTQSYHGAVIMGLLLAATLGAQWLLERRPQWSAITATAVGVLLGLVASPWFPRNVGYLVFHTVFKTTDAVPDLVGSEWLPIPPDRLLTSALVAHVSLAAALVAWGVRWRGGGRPVPGTDTLAALALTALFLVMAAFAWRFLEYYAPFAVLTAALLWRDGASRAAPRGRGRALVPALLVAGLAWGIVQGVRTLSAAPRTPFDAYADMVAYIEAHDARPMVFNTRWPDFQSLVSWTHRARYVAGLDGHYLLFGDPVRFRVWYDIARGSANGRDDNMRRVAATFGAQWAVVARVQPAIAQSFARDPAARLVLSTRDGWLFQLAPGAGR
ncbi:MAG TPA: hypothetical protein VFE23_09435 [Usitatibacter sp.]|jgi:hypothetical protein|nr:hypothetical protein [Usitatibacter sp.]